MSEYKPSENMLNEMLEECGYLGIRADSYELADLTKFVVKYLADPENAADAIVFSDAYLARMDDSRFSGGCGGGYDGEIHFFVEATRTSCKEQWNCALGYKHEGDHQKVSAP